jgi:hypothetical protein
MISCDNGRTRYGGKIDEMLIDIALVIAEVYVKMRKEGYDQKSADTEMFVTLCLGLYGANRIMEEDE